VSTEVATSQRFGFINKSIPEYCTNLPALVALVPVMLAPNGLTLPLVVVQSKPGRRPVNRAMFMVGALVAFDMKRPPNKLM
jgi:hypothetical protein